MTGYERATHGIVALFFPDSSIKLWSMFQRTYKHINDTDRNRLFSVGLGEASLCLLNPRWRQQLRSPARVHTCSSSLITHLLKQAGLPASGLWIVCFYTCPWVERFPFFDTHSVVAAWISGLEFLLTIRPVLTLFFCFPWGFPVLLTMEVFSVCQPAEENSGESQPLLSFFLLRSALWLVCFILLVSTFFCTFLTLFSIKILLCHFSLWSAFRSS